jgi:hypothetical protein
VVWTRKGSVYHNDDYTIQLFAQSLGPDEWGVVRKFDRALLAAPSSFGRKPEKPGFRLLKDAKAFAETNP